MPQINSPWPLDKWNSLKHFKGQFAVYKLPCLKLCNSQTYQYYGHVSLVFPFTPVRSDTIIFLFIFSLQRTVTPGWETFYTAVPSISSDCLDAPRTLLQVDQKDLPHRPCGKWSITLTTVVCRRQIKVFATVPLGTATRVLWFPTEVAMNN